MGLLGSKYAKNAFAEVPWLDLLRGREVKGERGREMMGRDGEGGKGRVGERGIAWEVKSP